MPCTLRITIFPFYHSGIDKNKYEIEKIMRLSVIWFTPFHHAFIPV